MHGFAACHVSKLLIVFRLQDKNTEPNPPFIHKIWWGWPKLLIIQFRGQNHQDKILLKFPNNPSSLFWCFLGLWNVFLTKLSAQNIWISKKPSETRIQDLSSFCVSEDYEIVSLTKIISSKYSWDFQKNTLRKKDTRPSLFWCLLNRFPNYNHQLKLILKFP
jgi:hypothetical protein